MILTFGPEGAPTGHRDHRAMSRVATAAFFLSGLRTAYPDQLTADSSRTAPRDCTTTRGSLRFADPKLKLESVPATAKIDSRPWNEHRSSRRFMRARDAAVRGYELF